MRFAGRECGFGSGDKTCHVAGGEGKEGQVQAPGQAKQRARGRGQRADVSGLVGGRVQAAGRSGLVAAGLGRWLGVKRKGCLSVLYGVP